jgi:predicted metalloendopeptidase
LNKIKLYQRLEKMNSQLQSVCKADPHEINQVKWLTHQTQELNHQRFEDTCVKLGFARLPADKEERERVRL